MGYKKKTGGRGGGGGGGGSLEPPLDPPLHCQTSGSECEIENHFSYFWKKNICCGFFWAPQTYVYIEENNDNFLVQ